jgi:hypothetical protein
MCLVGHAGGHLSVLNGESGQQQEWVCHGAMLNPGVDSRVKRQLR